jgi:hypothetical protein
MRRIAEHGSRSKYNDGCRCDECREANRWYKAAKQAANLSETASRRAAYDQAGYSENDPALHHGTLSTYEWYGCRCSDCKRAARKQWRHYQFMNRLRTRGAGNHKQGEMNG